MNDPLASPDAVASPAGVEPGAGTWKTWRLPSGDALRLPPPPSPGATDPNVVAAAWELLKSARYGQATTERAAFIVRSEGGGLELAIWPYAAEFARARYRGAVPAGAVGIIHTHPNGIPLPSAGDAELAKRIGMPVYVLTRMSITRTDGARTEAIAVGDWNPAR